jgi:hypothetical protein
MRGRIPDGAFIPFYKSCIACRVYDMPYPFKGQFQKNVRSHSDWKHYYLAFELFDI